MTGYVICGVEFRQEAFRLEWQQEPQAEEMDAYQRYLGGAPLLPASWPLWQAWLNRVQEMTVQCTISRVVLLDDQPTRYQQWRMWAAPWHRNAGESILFMPLRKAEGLGIPVGNWWVFDHRHVKDISGNLITGPRAAACLTGCDLAIQHASETIPA